MIKEDFNKKIKELGLSREDFSKMVGLSYGAVSNWNDEAKPIPPWVESWLENYEKAKSYEDVKDKVLEIEGIR